MSYAGLIAARQKAHTEHREMVTVAKEHRRLVAELRRAGGKHEPRELPAEATNADRIAAIKAETEELTTAVEVARAEAALAEPAVITKE